MLVFVCISVCFVFMWFGLIKSAFTCVCEDLLSILADVYACFLPVADMRKAVSPTLDFRRAKNIY